MKMDDQGEASLRLSSLFSSLHENIIDNDRLSDIDEGNLISQELAAVPTTERNKIFEEVHGVYNSAVEETEEMISQSLQQLTHEISKIRKKSAFEKAFFLAPQFAGNREFRLMFLRADYFDCKRSARRIIKYFELKQELWGEERLTKEITLNDFSTEDTELFMTGGIQIRPSDSRGRPILFFLARYFQLKRKDYKNLYRITWYLLSVMLEDENAQRKGIIDIGYHLGEEEKAPKKDEERKPRQKQDGGGETNEDEDGDHATVSKAIFRTLSESIMNAHMLRDAIPFRCAALHYCYDTPEEQKFMSLKRLAVGKECRLRFRPHSGTHQECQQALKSYGISEDILPIDKNGKLKIKEFRAFVRMRQHKEDNAPPHSDIRVSNLDVLLGRGKPYQSFPGNINMVKLVEENVERYREAFDKRPATSNSGGGGGAGGASSAGSGSSNSTKARDGADTDNAISSTTAKQRVLTKMDVVLGIISQVRAQGGRFLERGISPTTGVECWVSAKKVDIISKITISFQKRARLARETELVEATDAADNYHKEDIEDKSKKRPASSSLSPHHDEQTGTSPRRRLLDEKNEGHF